jgi:hypothetical protein
VRSLGLGDSAWALREAMAPVAWVSAQLGYLLEPLFGAPQAGADGLPGLLEDPQRYAAFVESLHEEAPT